MGMICCLREASDADIAALLKKPEQIHDFLEQESTECDLDKSWHGIHFLLTGNSWDEVGPLCYLVGGGEIVGNEDVGYGPARALSSDQVSEFNSALRDISTENFRSRFDPGAMMLADIYPDIWDRDPEDDDVLGYLAEYFEYLKDFIEKVASQKKGLLVYIT